MANFLRKIIINNKDVCVLAGDIGNPYQENYNIIMDEIIDYNKMLDLWTHS